MTKLKKQSPQVTKEHSVKRFASTALKTQITEMFSAAAKEPVEITKHGKTAYVLMSEEQFRRFEALEDAAWGARAMEAMKGGFVRGEEAETALAALIAQKSL